MTDETPSPPRRPDESAPGVEPATLANPAGVKTFGLVRIFCSDGFMFDTPLSVPWEVFLADMFKSGAVMFQNAYIGRQFIVRMHRFNNAEALPEAFQAPNVVPMKPVV